MAGLLVALRCMFVEHFGFPGASAACWVRRCAVRERVAGLCGERRVIFRLWEENSAVGLIPLNGWLAFVKDLLVDTSSVL